MSAWAELSQPESDSTWRLVDQRFDFRPSVLPKEWPGFNAPSPFATWAIPDPWSAAATEELHDIALAAFRAALAPGRRMFALDWQHPCFWFEPHVDVDVWSVPVLPNGDYFVFLAPELDWGWFGHPWEQSICVFGERLLTTLSQRPPALFDRMLRQG